MRLFFKKVAVLLLCGCFFLLNALSNAEDTKDPNLKRQLKIEITAPIPGQTVKGEVKIQWKVIDSCAPLNEEKTQTGTTNETQPAPKFIAQYFVDYKLVGENTDLDAGFVLDTRLFKNGNHIIMVNVADDHPHVASYSVKVKVKN